MWTGRGCVSWPTHKATRSRCSDHTHTNNDDNMTLDAAGFPRLEPDEPLDLRVVSDDGVHALRAELRNVEAVTQRLVVSWPTERLRL